MTHSKAQEPTLADLIGAPVKVEVGSIQISIQPLGWYESVEVIDVIFSALETAPSLPVSKDGASAVLQGAQFTAWLAWLNVNRDALVKFCNLASKQDSAVIERLSPVHLLELVFAVIEVNADFFGQSLPGLVARVGTRGASLVNRLKVAATQAGFTTTSSASLPTATGTPS